MAKSSTPASRGNQTREALILAALEVFGRAGYDAASTRAIARAAGVNQALIGYHFGGKRGLYIGVFEHIVAQMQQRMAPVAAAVVRELEHVPGAARARRKFALGQMLSIFDAYTDMINDKSAAGWVRLILREQQDPSDAFQLLYDGIMARLLGLLAKLVALAAELDEASEACRIRTLMMLGQVLIFYIARGMTSRHLAWESISPDHIAAIKQQFRLMLESQFAQGVARS